MTFITKFSIGNIVYIFIGNAIKEYIITGIYIYMKKEISIYYQLKSTTLNNTQTIKEHELFGSKEEATTYGLKTQGLTCGVKELE